MVSNRFNSVLIIGMGLMGSSLARALYHYQVAKNVYGLDNDEIVLKKCNDLKLIIRGESDINNFKEQFDLIIICSPLSTYQKVFSYLDHFVKKKTLLTDVGSTKVSVIEDYMKEVFKLHINLDQEI